MGWETKTRGDQKKGYYYHSIKPAGQPNPVRIYLGRGAEAQQVAADIEKRKKARAAAKRAIERVQTDVAVLDDQASEVRKYAVTLATTWMLCAGFCCHHGEWRRSMKKNREPRPEPKPARKKTGLYNNPTFLRNTLASLNERAGKGNKDALKDLEQMLQDHPELLDDVDNLTTTTLEAWLRRASGDDPVRAAAFRKEVAQMRADLLGEDPTPIERLLVDNVLTSLLALKHAERLDAMTGPNDLAYAHFVSKRVAQTQARFANAVKWLTLLRATAARGFSPMPKLKVFAAAQKIS